MKLVKRSIIVMILFMLLFPFIGSKGFASDALKDKKVYMIIANGLSLKDIDYMNNLKKIINKGSIGLMNTRGVLGYDKKDGYITINTSNKSLVNDDTMKFIELNNKNLDDIEGNIVNIKFNKLILLNNKSDYTSFIGALGKNLHDSGYKTAVFGNSDTADLIVRTNCLIAMDENGFIDYGEIDNILENNFNYPYKLKTNYNKLLSEIEKYKNKVSLSVIESGDLNRLHTYSKRLTTKEFLEYRKKIINDIDNFIGNFIKKIDKSNSLVFIVSPNRPSSEIDVSKLSPLIIFGDKIDRGILTSSTTRREGLVSNMDIGPTITGYLRASDKHFVGRSIYDVDKVNNLQYIKKLNARTNIVSNLRGKILRGYTMLVMIFITIGIIILVNKKLYKNKMIKYYKMFLLVILSLPSILLVNGLLEVPNKFYFIIYTLLILFGYLVLLHILKIKEQLLLTLSISLLLIILDIILSGDMIKFSVLGYDPIIGARYFGIGNELVGVLLGTLPLVCGILIDKLNRVIYSLILLFITVVIVASPRLGANLGGTISITFCGLIFTIKALNIKISGKKIILGVAIVFIILNLMVVVDIYINNNSPSHLGRTILMIKEKGIFYLINIMIRKMKVNIRLIKVSMWSNTLYFLILTMSTLLFVFKDKIKKLLMVKKYLAIGLISGVLGSLVGLLVNDSGIVLSSIANVFITTSIIYVIMCDRNRVI